MPAVDRFRAVAWSRAAAASTLLALAGCASTQLDATWSDAQLVPGTLRGARVMIACEAHDSLIKQLCEDRLSAEVVARGATPVLLADTGGAGPGRSPLSAAALAAARNAGAKAVLVHAVTIADVSTGSGVTLGIGGVSIGSSSSSGVGVGVSVPVGGGRTTNGHALDARLTDAASGRVVWSAKASTRPSADAPAQLDELTKAAFAAGDKVPLF